MDEQRPHAVVLRREFERRPPRTPGRLHLAAFAEFLVVAVGRVLGEEIVGDPRQEQRDTGNDHGQTPAQEFVRAEREHRRGVPAAHGHLRDAPAESSPIRRSLRWRCPRKLSANMTEVWYCVMTNEAPMAPMARRKRRKVS